MSESITSLFDDSVRRFKQRPAIQYFCSKTGTWLNKNWAQLSVEVARLAHALSQAGVKPKDRIALLSLTRPEWVVADLAIMKTGAISVPIYHSSLSDQISYILSDAGAEIILLDSIEQLTKVRALQDDGKKINKVIVFDLITNLRDNECLLDSFVSGQSELFDSVKISKNEIASLVYTSGTTGEPKGAMISHDNLLYEAQVIDKLGILSHEDVQLIFLPLAHIFARVLEVAWIRTGHLLAFAESIDKLIDNMSLIKPTFMAGVPRVYEKIRAKVVERALASGMIKKALAQFAFNQADKLAHDSAYNSLSLRLAKRLVFTKIGCQLKEKFGGRIRFLVSGGAQLSPEVAAFFHLSGIILCEGYGLTETTAATCLNLPWAIKSGTVGRALPGTELRLSQDQEILVRGRGVFLGFWGRDDQTSEVLSKDAWFSTGDIGEIDQEGYVKIVDRKKDIIVTSQGKNIAPQRVENLIKSKSPVIAHVVVVGDRLPYLTALIALDQAHANELVHTSANGVKLAEIATDARVYQEVKTAITAANNTLASFEQVKRFHILDREFVVGKELTPTLKVKRKLCAEQFQREIKVLYA